ncbi:ribulose-phosphate 3-epimerase [Cohnella sp. GCM10027633]|uniref:ribulose-phosphate 3-epimerase n=1 Tax=unclassified Cohnella TaxID=2636738 RepID=UPI00363C7D8A
MPGKISPSIMCVDFLRLQDQLAALQAAGVEYLHVDIMDGKFVPNFTLGPDFVRALRAMTNIPMDVHLMVTEPERHLELFGLREGDLVSVHQEATVHLQRTLQQIRAYGAKSAVAINPATPIYAVEDVLDDVDVILIMTVNPGFAGQRLVPSTLQKIKRLRAMLEERGYGHIEIEVDGNVSFENAKRMREAGADLFVAGTSSIFRPGEDLLALTNQLRACIT